METRYSHQRWEEDEEETHDHHHADEKEEPISIYLHVEEEHYEAGSNMNGTVYLHVPDSAARATSCCADNQFQFSGIDLILEGQEIVLLEPYVEFLPAEFHIEKIYKTEQEIIHFHHPLIAGFSPFPFSFELPKQLPSSMEFDSGNDIICELQYRVRAKLRSSRASNNGSSSGRSSYPVLESVQTIRIAPSGGQHAVTDNDAVAGTDGIVSKPPPTSFEIKSCLTKKGYVHLALNAESISNSSSTAATTAITAEIVGMNDSSVDVNHLLVQLVEHVSCATQTLTFSNRNIISETIVPVDHLPSWQRRRKMTKKELQQQQQSNGTTSCNSNGAAAAADTVRVQLQIKDANDSYHGKTVLLHHSIEVTVITKKKFATNPKCTAPIKIYRQSLDAEEYSSTPPVMAHAVLLKDEVDDDSTNTQQQYKDIFNISTDIPEAVAVFM